MKCTTYYRIASICAALEKGDIGQGWSLIGCTREGGFARYEKTRGKPDQKALSAGLSGEKAPVGSVSLDDVSIEFRSAEAPTFIP